MDTVFSWINMLTSAAIVILAICFRHLTLDQNIVKRIGYNGIVVFCAAVLIKAMYNTSIDVFRSDYYGIMVRVFFLIMLVGDILSAYSDGVGATFKKKSVDILVAHHR